MRKRSSQLVINVCFHGLGSPRRTLEAGEDLYWISRDQYLRALDEMTTWPDVSISFDDGNSSDVEHGLTPLLDRGLSASFFVVAGRVGTPGSVGVDELRLLRSRGMVVGSHGMGHRPWPGLDDSDLHTELVTARAALEDLVGAPVDQAALPLGRYDRRVLAELRTLGYQRVYSSDRAPARAGAWLQPRYSVTRDDTPASLRERILRRQRLVDRIRGTANELRKRLR